MTDPYSRFKLPPDLSKVRILPNVDWAALETHTLAPAHQHQARPKPPLSTGRTSSALASFAAQYGYGKRRDRTACQLCRADHDGAVERDQTACTAHALAEQLRADGFVVLANQHWRKERTFAKLGVDVRVERTLWAATVDVREQHWVPRWLAAVLRANLSRRRRDRTIKRLVADADLREALLLVDEAPGAGRFPRCVAGPSSYFDQVRDASELKLRLRAFLESVR